MIIDDGTQINKSVRPAKDLRTLKGIYGGNGEFIRIKDVTNEWTNKYMFSDVGKNQMYDTLKRANYGNDEINIILALMDEIR